MLARRQLLATAAGLALLPEFADAQAVGAGVDRLYNSNCGDGVAGDTSLWSPGVDVGKPRDFVNSCYLIHHARGWMLWDTGLPNAIASKPQGEPSDDPRSIH